MPSHTIFINNVDAETSGVLGRSRLDGLDRVPVPFEECYVHAWQRGAPEPGMDVDTLMIILRVRAKFCALSRASAPNYKPPPTKLSPNKLPPNKLSPMDECHLLVCAALLATGLHSGVWKNAITCRWRIS